MSTLTAMTPGSRNKPKQTGEPLHLSDARLSCIFRKIILRKIIWGVQNAPSPSY